jgi:hypothetical protein
VNDRQKHVFAGYFIIVQNGVFDVEDWTALPGVGFADEWTALPLGASLEG